MRRFRFLLILFPSDRGTWNSYYVSLENFAKFNSRTLFDSGSSSSSLKKKNEQVYSIFYCLYIFYWFKSKRKYASYTLYELHYSALTSWNIYCSKPVHLLGLGNKFGVRIINTTKTPENLCFPSLMVISTNLGCLGS